MSESIRPDAVDAPEPEVESETEPEVQAHAGNVLALQQLGVGSPQPEEAAGPGSIFSSALCNHQTE
jgi:hypothetical protein